MASGARRPRCVVGCCRRLAAAAALLAPASAASQPEIVAPPLIQPFPAFNGNCIGPATLTVDAENGADIYCADSVDSRLAYYNGTANAPTAEAMPKQVVVNVAGQRLNMTLGFVSAIASDVQKNLYLADFATGQVFRRTPAGEYGLIANSDGFIGAFGDCGPATLARFRGPNSLAIIPAKGGRTEPSLALVDSGNNRVVSMELTDWPFCVLAPTTASCVATDFLNRTTGEACSGDCSFTSLTPDACAFECSNYGKGVFPTKLPTMDFEFNESQLKELFNVSEGYLTLPTRPPLGEASFALKADYSAPDGTILAANTSFLAGIVWHGSLRRFNATEAASHRVALEFLYYGSTPTPVARRLNDGPPAGTLTLRFERRNISCGRWSWQESTALGPDGPVPSGRCFLMPAGATNCSASSNVTGSAACRPGRLRPLIGSVRNNGQEYTPDYGKLPLEVAPLEARLLGPRGVLYFESQGHYDRSSWRGPGPTLLVSDTRHGRVVGMALSRQRLYKVRFWTVIAGGDRVSFAQLPVLKLVISAYLGLSKNPEIVEPSGGGVPAASPACQGEQAETRQPSPAESLRTAANGFCSSLACTAQKKFGFQTKACCTTACTSCLADCSGALSLVYAATSSSQRCSAFAAYRSCLNTTARCTSITGYGDGSIAGEDTGCQAAAADAATDNEFMTQLLEMDTGVLMPLNAGCEAAIPSSRPCPGCDEYIFKLTGSNLHGLLETSNASEVLGVLMEIELDDMKSLLDMAKTLNKLGTEMDCLANSSVAEYPVKLLPFKTIPGCESMQELWKFYTFIDKHVSAYFGGSPPDLKMAFMSNYGATTGYADWVAVEERDDRTLFTMFQQAPDDTFADSMRASMLHPVGLAADRVGRVYLTDSATQRVLRVDDPWTTRGDERGITRIAGIGFKSFDGDDKEAERAALDSPTGIAAAGDGSVLVADSGNQQVRNIFDLVDTDGCDDNARYFDMLTLDGKVQAKDKVFEKTKTLFDSLLCKDTELRTYALGAIKECGECADGDTPACNDAKRGAGSRCAADRLGRPNAGDDVLAKLLLQQIPDCDACATMDYCSSNSLVKADLEWDDAVPCNGTSTALPCLTTLLNASLVSLLAHALDASTRLKKQMSDDEELTRKDMNIDFPPFLHNQTSTQERLNLLDVQYLNELDSVELVPPRVQQIKDIMCTTAGSVLSVGMMLMNLWYISVENFCTDGPVSKRIGRQFYNRSSRVPQYFLAPTQDGDGPGLLPSTCHMGCGPLQASLFTLWPYGSVDCCGSAGYLCQEGEGYCSSDADCALGLSCVPDSCLWGQSGQSCCGSPTTSRVRADLLNAASGLSSDELLGLLERRPSGWSRSSWSLR